MTLPRRTLLGLVAGLPFAALLARFARASAVVEPERPAPVAYDEAELRELCRLIERTRADFGRPVAVRASTAAYASLDAYLQSCQLYPTPHQERLGRIELYGAPVWLDWGLDADPAGRRFVVYVTPPYTYWSEIDMPPAGPWTNMSHVYADA